MRKWFVLIAAAALAGVASAQNVQAFKPAEFQDLFVTQSGDSFTITLGDNPMVNSSVGNNQWTDIDDLVGFWILSDDGTLTATGDDFGVWDFHQNTGGGTSNFGWKTEKKNGILADGSQTFTFDSVTGTVDAFGFMLHANGKPAHLRMDANPVPEPGTMVALATGGLLLIRRRRKQK